jgi:hypothetical protein
VIERTYVVEASATDHAVKTAAQTPGAQCA